MEERIKIKQATIDRWDKARINYGNGFYAYITKKSGVPYWTLYSAFCSKPQLPETIAKIDDVIKNL